MTVIAHPERIEYPYDGKGIEMAVIRDFAPALLQAIQDITILIDFIAYL